MNVLSKVDHTLLKPTASWPEINDLCKESIEYNTASVCIPTCYVKRVRITYPKLNICTTVGFPLGYDTTATKALAVQAAVGDGPMK